MQNSFDQKDMLALDREVVAEENFQYIPDVVPIFRLDELADDWPLNCPHKV
jgi:hypothetical protein